MVDPDGRRVDIDQSARYGFVHPLQSPSKPIRYPNGIYLGIIHQLQLTSTGVQCA